MTEHESPGLDRREVLRRAALLLGGVLSAPTIAGVLAGCESPRSNAAASAGHALSADQSELVATIAEHILPETDTPGARSAGVHHFIDTMMAEYYPAPERQRFIDGLADVDARARRLAGRPFLQCAPDQQRAVLDVLDRDAFAQTGGSMPFFRTFKELTIVGYYTSEAGATRELKYVRVPARFEGCVPFSTVGRTWAV